MASLVTPKLPEVESYLSEGTIPGVVGGEDWCGSGDTAFQSADPGSGDMLAEVCVTVLGVASIALKNAAPVSYIIEVRAGVMLGMFTASVIGVVTDIVVIVLAGVDSSICVVTIIALESMPIVASFEETLFLDW